MVAHGRSCGLGASAVAFWFFCVFFGRSSVMEKAFQDEFCPKIQLDNNFNSKLLSRFGDFNF